MLYPNPPSIDPKESQPTIPRLSMNVQVEYFIFFGIVGRLGSGPLAPFSAYLYQLNGAELFSLDEKKEKRRVKGEICKFLWDAAVCHECKSLGPVRVEKEDVTSLVDYLFLNS